MATTAITNIYEPVTFEAAVDEKAVELNAFIQSGVLVEDERVSEMASAGGRTGDLTGFAPLTQNEPNYSDDNPATTSTPDNIGKFTMTWRLAAMNNSWSTMDLARELALKDPLAAITDKVGQYWATEVEKRVVQSAMGILADNVANDSSDMLYSIATDDAAAVTAAEKISAEAVVAASATAGDHQLGFTAIAMHSVPFATLRTNNLIDYIPDSEGVNPYPYYLGMRVIVDDSLPAVAGTNRITYTTILFAAGVFVHGNGRVEMPSELERKASTGNGGGQTILHSRRSEIIHPLGTAFLSASISGASPSLAELADATEWNRVWSRKSVQVAFLQTNG